MAQIQHGTANSPRRFCSTLTWFCHTVAPDVSALSRRQILFTTVKVIWVQWTRHAQETSLRWFFMTWCVTLHCVIRKWVNCGHKGMNIFIKNTQTSCGILHASVGTKGEGACQQISPIPSQPQLNSDLFIKLVLVNVKRGTLRSIWSAHQRDLEAE